ncbi:unnamed protein product [Sphagnum compactum]
MVPLRPFPLTEKASRPAEVQDLQHLQTENGWRNATREKILREVRVLQRADSGSTLSLEDSTSRLALMATLRCGSFVGVLGL